MKTSRGTRNLLPKEQAYDLLLSPNGPFVQAVQRSSVEDAAHAAVNVLMEIVGNLARAGTSAGASASSMLSALIAVGDEVILKSENRGSASMVGTVSESIVNKGSARPVYRVRWSNGHETTEAFDELKMIKKAPGRQEQSPAKRRLVPLASISGGGSARELITEMCKQLLSFEESLDWDFVYAEKFRRYRSPWRLQLSRATSLKQFEQAFRDLVKVLYVEPDMMNKLHSVLDPATLEEMRSLAEAQDIPNFAALWAVLHSELQGWLAYCKTKGQEGKATYHLQTLEALYETDGNIAFSKLDFGYSADDLANLRRAVQEESKFIENKITGLNEMLLAGQMSMSDEIMKGVTYETSGLGGSYGGHPRLRSSVLQCLLPGYNSDEDVDNCSEVTDWSQQWGQAALPGDNDATSRQGAMSASHDDRMQHGGSQCTSQMEVCNDS